MTPIVVGPLSITQANGQCTLAIDDSVVVGGGSAKGVVSAQGQASIVINEELLVQIGLAAVASKFPVLSPFLSGATAVVDSAIAGL